MPTIEETLLTDLKFTDDLKTTATGDYETVSGLANLREAVIRRCLTKPGTLVHRPTYGIGLVDFQNATINLPVKRAIANRMKAQLPEDPRINKIVSLSVASEDESPEKTIISLSVDAVGYGETEMSFTPFGEVP